jgi:hypothetical protein
MLAWVMNVEIALLVAGALADVGLGLALLYQAWDNRLNRVAVRRLEALVRQRGWGQWQR